VSFSSLILSLCCVYSRERSVWSCGVVEWIGRPLISPTPSPNHRQVTRTGSRGDEKTCVIHDSIADLRVVPETSLIVT